jgi:ABC-type branched-subunit amino acid transport system ATPase component
MATVTTFEGVEKVYADGTHAARGLDLEMEHGAFMALVGPSGFGSTTALRIVTGLEEITGSRSASATGCDGLGDGRHLDPDRRGRRGDGRGPDDRGHRHREPCLCQRYRQRSAEAVSGR